MVAPKLRFREFVIELSAIKVKNLLEKCSDSVAVIPSEMYREIGIRSHGKGIFHKEPVTGDSLGNKRVFWVKKNALVLNIVFAWEQAVAMTSNNEEGFIASHRFPMYIPKNNECNIDYIRRYFLTPKGKSLLELASPGGAGRNKTLGQKNFEELLLIVPEVNEQIKISKFLSSVDERIALQTKQYELLCQYKKGVMQRIFSQELRFKDEDGEAFAEWESKLFTNIYKFISTNSLSRSELNYENGSIKNIHYGDIHTKLSVNFDVKKENIPFIIKSIKVPDEQYCKENDLIIADASEDYKDVGKCIEIIATNDEKIVAGLHTFLARPQIDVARGFGGYMMQSEIVRKPIKIMATGVSVLSISKKNLSNLQLKMPCKQEQTKIADFLTAIDDKITAAKKQLEQLKQWKQGLLQQMFI